VEDAVDVQEDRAHADSLDRACTTSLSPRGALPQPSQRRSVAIARGSLRPGAASASGGTIDVEPVPGDRDGDARVDADERPHLYSKARARLAAEDIGAAGDAPRA
jgi:hypothetical protein